VQPSVSGTCRSLFCGPRAPVCFEGGKQDFSSSKGDDGDILSEFRHRSIGTSGFVEDGCSGWLQVTTEIVGIEAGFSSHLGSVGVLTKLE
jgi:hypothetical protein